MSKEYGNPENERVKRVALYLRVSTKSQATPDKYSLGLQKDRLKKYCESFGYEVNEELIYTDGGFSGGLAKEKRPALKKLFEDAELKKFDIVAVYRLDRFFRSLGKLKGAVDRLIELNINFQSASESFDTNTPHGRMTLNILGTLAEYEKEVITERMVGGREEAAKSNKWVTGVPPYGYRVDKTTKKLVEVPPEALVVKQFYEWLVYEKCSLGEICRRANERGLPAPKHKTIKTRKTYNYWWKRTVNRILVNEVYTGDFYFRKYKRPFKYLDAVLNEEHQRPKEVQIPIKVPPIVSKELFQASIRQLTKNKKDSTRNTKRPYLFGKLLYCGYTGHKLQSGYQTPRVHKDSSTLGKYYHTYVPENRGK
jgi:site-specific DNA recombinase